MSRFDLDTALRTWRHLLQQRRAFLPDDLDELEQHLRDFVRARVAAGLGEEEAFREAVARIGDSFELEAEYRKVQLVKQKRKHSLWRVLTGEAIMFRNYLTTSYRTLVGQRGFTLINLVGLAVGLAAFLCLALYIHHKLSYDRFWPDAERLYRVHGTVTEEQLEAFPDLDPDTEYPMLMPGLAPALAETYPEVEAATAITRTQLLVSRGETHQALTALVADDDFFNVFQLPFLSGNVQTALKAPRQLVLTASAAQRLFGEVDPVGLSLLYDNQYDFEVTGVIPDPPATSHVDFEAILSFSQQRRSAHYSGVVWNSIEYYTYLRMREGASAEALESKLSSFFEEVEKPVVGSNSLALQAVTRIHLHSKGVNEIAPQSDVRYLYLFGAVAIMILLLACINYTNLATARATKRIKEVAVRKVVGASRGQLLAQFLGEAMLVALISLGFALVLVPLALPLLNMITGIDLSISEVAEGPIGGYLLVLVLLVGVLSGVYPALYLSRFQPIRVLIGGRSARGLRLRQALVGFQFVACLALLLAAVVVQKQLHFLQHERLGFDKEHVLVVTGTQSLNGLGAQRTAFEEEIRRHSSVVSVSSGPISPYGGWGKRPALTPAGELMPLLWLNVGYDYVRTLGLSLVAGRDFSRTFGTDSADAVLLTASAAQRYGILDKPAGQVIAIGPGDHRTVVGIVEDFHLRPKHEPMEPMLMRLEPVPMWMPLLVRTRPGATEEVITHLRQTWQQFVPHRPFEFTFLDEAVARMYQSEQRLARIFSTFTALAALIAALGLFGLAAYDAERRTKEVGIRKAVGATATNIVLLLTKDVVKLIFWSAIIALPLAYLALHPWLESFAYQVDLSPMLFIQVTGALLCLALLAVGTQALRAAHTNPAKALRYE